MSFAAAQRFILRHALSLHVIAQQLNHQFQRCSRLWLAALAGMALVSPGQAVAEGGFISVQSGITESQDVDSIEGNPIKIHFGANILDNFALEMGLFDMGEAQFDLPQANFENTNRDNPGAPTFIGLSSRQFSQDNEAHTATYTGLANIRPQGFLVTFRYNIELLDSLDLFVKTGANIWWADYEFIERTAETTSANDGTIRDRVTERRQTAAVDQITGGGLLWEPISNFKLRAELETTALDSKDFARARFQLITFGLQYEY